MGNRKSDNVFDGNKKVKGIKRSIVVDRNGLILGRYGSLSRNSLPTEANHGDIVDAVKKDFEIEMETSNTPNGTKGFTTEPLRWVVERTFAWLDGFSRLARNYEETDESAEEMIDFDTIKLMLARI